MSSLSEKVILMITEHKVVFALAVIGAALLMTGMFEIKGTQPNTKERSAFKFMLIIGGVFFAASIVAMALSFKKGPNGAVVTNPLYKNQ